MNSVLFPGILSQVQVTRLGHATLLIQTHMLRLLIDPGGFSSDWHEVTDLDALLITHQHPDHVDAAGVAALMEGNPGTRVLVEQAVVPMLADHGVEAAGVEPEEWIDLGGLGVEVVGGIHALIHDSIRRVGNVGFVISEPDGPRLFHPGDSYDYVPEAIDVLALPITAPWARVGTTADFLAAVAPEQAFPIHDAILSEPGWELYLRVVGNIVGDAVSLHHLGATGDIDL